MNIKNTISDNNHCEIPQYSCFLILCAKNNCEIAKSHFSLLFCLAKCLLQHALGVSVKQVDDLQRAHGCIIP